MSRYLFNPFSGTFDAVLDQASEISFDDSGLDITAADVQTAVEELDAAIAAIPTPLTYVGTWNATTNSPALANTDTGVEGYLYQVNVAGSVDFGAGSISFEVGDKVANNGSIWEKWDMTDAVSSVNGATGAVTLSTSDIGEGSNLYFTDERARDAAGAMATSSSKVSLAYDDGLNTLTPNIVAGSLVNADINGSAAIDATKIADGSVTSTEFQYISTLSSNAQTQLDLKAPLASPTFTGTVSGITATMVGAASTTLGNLAATTLINNPLLPLNDNDISVGSLTSTWANFYAPIYNVVNATQNTNGGIIQGNQGNTSITGASVSLKIQGSDISGVSTGITVQTQNSSTNNATATGTYYLETGNNTAGTGDSGSINATTGTSLGGASGAINIASGSTVNTGDTGDLNLATGAISNTASTANTGNLSIVTGANNTTSGTPGQTGNITLTTGAMTGSHNGVTSGSVSISSGASKDFSSGSLNLNTGGSEYQSGDIFIATGAGLVADDGWAGDVLINTGQVTGNAEGGEIQIGTGQVGTGPSGHLVLSTGAATGAGTSGNISLTPGATVGGTSGKIIFANSGEGTLGKVWTDGTGTGGGAWTDPKSEVKNYLGIVNGANGNGNFELGATTGWALGVTGALVNGLPTVAPTFGSGASGDLSISAVTSGKLAGAYSLSYASAAATTAGNMVASSAFTVDTSDQAKVLTVKFAYSATSNPANANWSGTSSNSFAWAIYDVTNSAWIIPAGAFGLTQSSGVGICTGTFQTSSNGTSYHIVVYNANATSGAATVLFDDFYIGPETAPIGVVQTDWVAYTPTLTNFPTGSAYEVQSRRNGPNLEIRAKFTLAAGGTGAEARMSLGFNGVDGAVTSASTAVIPSLQIAGHGNISVNGAGQYDPLIEPNVAYLTFGIQAAGSAGLTKALGTSIASGTFSFTATVPIAGWSSNMQMSNDTDTRIVVALISGNPASATVGNPIIAPTADYDSHAAYNATTGRYTVPVSGVYKVFGALSSASSATTLHIYKNAVSSVLAGNLDSNGEATFAGAIKVVAGDLLDLRPGGTVDATAMNIAFERLSGPAVVAATETVAAIITGNPASATVGNPIIVPTIGYDSHAGYNATTGRYTVPVSGLYKVFGALLSASSATTLHIYKNAVSAALSGSLDSNGEATFTGMVNCVAGDIIDLRPGGTVDATEMCLNFEKVK